MDVNFIHWLTFIGIFFVAVIAPGPDFIMIVRNSLCFSRKAGIFTALGLGISIMVHVSYTLLGLSAIISQSILLYNCIKWVGSAYLIYIGFKAISSKGLSQKSFKASMDESKKCSQKTMSNKQAFISGLLTNLLNPKAALFFLAVFSQVIVPDTPMFWKLLSGVSASIIISLWFSCVAFFLTGNKIRALFLKFSKWIDRACGVALIALGIKMATTVRDI